MKTILVADRSIFIRSVLKQKLYKSNFSITGEAENGKQAVEKYSSIRPEIVMLEFLMPQLNGFEALREILRIDPQANIIMMSSLKEESLQRQSREMGAKGFILKPDFEGLIPTLESLEVKDKILFF